MANKYRYITKAEAVEGLVCQKWSGVGEFDTFRSFPSKESHDRFELNREESWYQHTITKYEAEQISIWEGDLRSGRGIPNEWFRLPN